MSHRVIAGLAKGRKLKLVPGESTRPIMDRVKEALFSIIGRGIYESNFLDLFGGTGSVGIEALSRGAQRAMFIEWSGSAIRTIQDNLKVTKLGDKAIIRRLDALAFIRGPAPADPFDYIYVAPPQYKGIWLEVLKILDENPAWVPDDETDVIVQLDPHEYDDPGAFEHLQLYDQRRYGKTMLLFYTRKQKESEADE
jgi:16S rRNA (guanine966-N2)-methyltransferase